MVRRMSIGIHGKHTGEAQEKRVSQTKLADWEWWSFEQVGDAAKRCAVGLRRALRDVGLPLMGEIGAREGGWGKVYMFADTR